VRLVLDGRTIADHFPGIGRYAFNLASALAPLLAPGDELIVLHDRHQPNTRFDLGGLASRPNLRLLEINARNFSLAEQWRVPNTLHMLQPSVYHSPYYVMPYWPGVPSVVTLYDVIPIIHPEDYSPVARLAFAVGVRLAARTARRVITISQASARDLRQLLGLPAATLSAIPLAADPIFVPQPDEAVARVRDRYGLPPAYVLYLGSNKPHKNLPRLVRAYTHLVGGAGQAPLVIAGHWDDRFPQARNVVTEAQCGERVAFIGPVAQADLPALFGGATLSVFPSLYEGFGLPPLEAMACGTPVACSSAASLTEVVGDAALTFDPLDEQAITAALTRGLDDAELRADLRQRGLLRARQFTWNRVAAQTLEVYRAAL
jgi:glycosyltransferase involved in cell wall biosynthesis